MGVLSLIRMAYVGSLLLASAVITTSVVVTSTSIGAGRTAGFTSANSFGSNSLGSDSFGSDSFGSNSFGSNTLGNSFGSDSLGNGQLAGTGSSTNHIAVAGAIPVIVILLILGLVEVILFSNVIINALLIHAVRNSKAEYTLPWLIINMIGIVFGILSLLGGGYFSILDVPLTIYFWIVIKSYRTQLQEGTLVTSLGHPLV